MLNKRNIKLTFSSFMVGIILGVSLTSVFATAAVGIYGYYGPFLGYNYQNQAAVSVNNYYAYATTIVESQNGGGIPIGYMGSQARLFKNDALYNSSTWMYNDDVYSGFNHDTSYNPPQKGSIYYSKGITSAYNGNGYNYYYTFQSPNLSY